jgi:hypothetical protein
MAYCVASMVGLMAIVSLTVDYGRAQVAKSELQAAADSVARYAMGGVTNGTAVSRALAAAADCKVDGRTLTMQSGDVELGRWISGAFVATTTNPDSVRVTARLASSRNNAVPLSFGAFLGRSTIDLRAVSTASPRAMVVAGTTNTSVNVDGRSSVFYAGMSSGTNVWDPWGGDTVSDTSATRVNGLGSLSNRVITLSATGSVSWQWWAGGSYAPDANGFPGTAASQSYPSMWSGISPVTAPTCSLVAVFLTDADPRTLTTPAALDFSTTTAQNYTAISPQIGQTFFVGTGVNPDGSSRQIVVPPGATRMFLGTLDSVAWRDNGGTIAVSLAAQDRTVVTVK